MVLEWKKCVLAVGDDELDVGDSDDASSEAEHLRDHVVDLDARRKSELSRLAGSGFPRVPGYLLRPRVPRMLIFAFVIVVFVFYSKKQI